MRMQLKTHMVAKRQGQKEHGNVAAQTPSRPPSGRIKEVPFRFIPGGYVADVAIVEPQTFQAAVSGQRPSTRRLILVQYKTWELVDKPDDTDVKCKWVYKKKIHEDGEVERFKARLVAKGYSQQHGIDCNEASAPASKSSTLRALMAKVAKEGMVVHQMDVMTAFLNGHLEESVCMEQPEGYEQGGRTIVCHLLKSLYGLKQAPRTRHLELAKEANKIGLQASDAAQHCSRWTSRARLHYCWCMWMISYRSARGGNCGLGEESADAEI
jgi:hypothetical protein